MFLSLPQRPLDGIRTYPQNGCDVARESSYTNDWVPRKDLRQAIREVAREALSGTLVQFKGEGQPVLLLGDEH